VAIKVYGTGAAPFSWRFAIMIMNKVRKIFGSDRRQSHRLKPADIPFFKSVAYNRGSEAQVVDISRGGMLLETGVRLRPQTKIWVELTTSRGVFETAGQVLRCFIVSLKRGATYRSAISFENPFHMMDDIENNPAKQFRDRESASAANFDEFAPGLFQTTFCGKEDQDVAFLTIVANDGCDASLISGFNAE
jgi:hypothetical protein